MFTIFVYDLMFLFYRLTLSILNMCMHICIALQYYRVIFSHFSADRFESSELTNKYDDKCQ